jgi:hypothetical protein
MPQGDADGAAGGRRRSQSMVVGQGADFDDERAALTEQLGTVSESLALQRQVQKGKYLIIFALIQLPKK